MRLPIERMAKVKRIVDQATVSDDLALRTFATSCLNQLSDVRRAISEGDTKRAEEAMRRAEKMAERIQPGEAGPDAARNRNERSETD